MSDSELESLTPTAERGTDGTWQGVLITDSHKRWGCSHRHSTVSEALACARELLAMVRGEA
jgi:hypothetical protein